MRATGAVLLLAGLLVPPAIAAEPDSELPDLNQRWSGATATLRRAWPLSAQPESGGAWGMYAGFEEGSAWLRGHRRVDLEGQPFYLYLLVAPDPSESRLPGRELPAGTELEISGWRYSDPERRAGAHLEMRLGGTSTRVKLGYDRHVGRARAASASVEWLGAVERHLRFEVFDLHSAGQRLPEPPRAGDSAPRTGERAEHARPNLIGVAIDPARVVAGERIVVVLNYELAGGACEVIERREIRDGERVVASFEDPVSRASGLHSSTKPIVVPTAARAGHYELRAQVSCAGRSDTGSAIFEVR